MMAAKEIEEVEAEIHVELECEEENRVDEAEERERSIRQKRKLLRGRITRAINRLLLSLTTGKLTEKRAERELIDLKDDFKKALLLHSEFYEFKSAKFDLLDRWENELSDEVYDIEEKIQDYLDTEKAMKLKSKGKVRSSIEDIEETDDVQQTENGKVKVEHTNSKESRKMEKKIENESFITVDAWIDDLVEYTETEFSQSSQEEMSIAQALYRLEASRDTPTLQLKQFDGNAMQYVDFIETFRIHIHQKGNLADDHRMAQLKMHLTGEAAHSISGLGSRFIREYLPTLMSRVKWRLKTRQLSVGDIVILVDYNLPRGQWQLARITEVFPGTDGTVRNVVVKTQHGLYRRSVQKCIVVLENNSDK